MEFEFEKKVGFMCYKIIRNFLSFVVWKWINVGCLGLYKKKNIYYGCVIVFVLFRGWCFLILFV